MGVYCCHLANTTASLTDKHRPRHSVCSIRPHPRYFAVRPGNSCQSTRRRPATEAATSDRQTASLVRNSHHHINVTRSMPLSPVPCLSPSPPPRQPSVARSSCNDVVVYYPRDAMLLRVLATVLCLSVRPSVCLCPSQVGVLSKRMNESCGRLS